MVHLPQVIVAFGIGLRFVVECQSRRGFQRGRSRAVQQPAKPVQDMGLGDNSAVQCFNHSALHQGLIVMQDQRQDIGHLPIPTGPLEQDRLQGTEAGWQLIEGGAVA